MNRRSFVAVLAGATLALTAGFSGVARAQDPDPKFVTGEGAIPGQYVVSFVDGAAGGPEGANQANQAESIGIEPIAIDPSVTASEICSGYGATLQETYGAVGVFMATMNETQARQMSHDSRVECVMADLPGQSDAVQSVPDYYEWGLDRIDQVTLPRNNTFIYNSTGAGVHAYVLDTGIWPDHPQIAGRVSLDYSAVSGTTPNDDNPSFAHGTACASIIGGSSTGVAKNVWLHSVKVTEGNNKAYVSAVSKGLDWVLKNHQNPAVVNMSLSFRKQGSSWFGLVQGTTPVEKAVRRVVNAGVTVVVSASNDNDDAGKYSPAWMDEVITVGASDRNDNRVLRQVTGSWSSNYGAPVDLFAPGFEVRAAFWRNTSTGRVLDYQGFGGTSAAAPFVSGVVAQYLQLNPYASPSAVRSWVINNATTGRLNPSTLPANTVNRLLFTNL